MPKAQTPSPTPLPDYTVRESARAKRVILRVTPRSGLEIVVPRGFDTSRVPGIVADKAEWLRQTFARLERRGIVPGAPVAAPDALHLCAVGETWRLEFVERETPNSRVRQSGPGRLLVTTGRDGNEGARTAVRRWLQARGRAVLVPWLRELSAELGLPFERAQVRGQRTRWGSCSVRGTISLNWTLLFLPRELARYVLIHELCHTRHMNHSQNFWALVARYEPRWYELDRALNAANASVPLWLS
ncbi:SprT family zinc-dependent metalloprotease [Desulfobaculum senezii]